MCIGTSGTERVGGFIDGGRMVLLEESLVATGMIWTLEAWDTHVTMAHPYIERSGLSFELIAANKTLEHQSFSRIAHSIIIIWSYYTGATRCISP